MSAILALAPLLLAASTTSQIECGQIPGWEAVLEDEQLRYIVIGEVHGSNEVPALFADAVCLTAQSSPVVVGLEISELDQQAINAFITSNGDEQAQRAFLQASNWQSTLKDGRSSVAMFALFERLRQMHNAGLVSAVIAFQRPYSADRPTREENEQGMAALLVESAMPGSRVIALVGNAHARLTEVHFETTYMPMAGHLPRAQTLTFNAISAGGTNWFCSAPDYCGPSEEVVAETIPPRELILDRAAVNSPYSGIIHLGAPATAAVPQEQP